MTQSLTRDRNAAYRSLVGAESVPMGICQSPLVTGARTAPRLNPSAVFLWSGGWISPQGLAGYPVAGSWQILLARPPGRLPTLQWSESQPTHRSLAMLQSRLCRRAFAGGRAQ